MFKLGDSEAVFDLSRNILIIQHKTEKIFYGTDLSDYVENNGNHNRELTEFDAGSILTDKVTETQFMDECLKLSTGHIPIKPARQYCELCGDPLFGEKTMCRGKDAHIYELPDGGKLPHSDMRAHIEAAKRKSMHSTDFMFSALLVEAMYERINELQIKVDKLESDEEDRYYGDIQAAELASLEN